MTDQAFEIKASSFTLTILQLKTFDVAMITNQLAKAFEKAPNFFQNTPVVFDLHRLQAIECSIEFPRLVAAAKAYRMIPIAVHGANDHQSQQAISAGLAIFSGQSPVKANLASAKVPAITPSLHESKMITSPVRSGQQIYAKNTDLIVLGPVSHGAELLADGNIHVYGSLRGRALAGVSGKTDARIFCHKFEAELISIAGLYQLNDQFNHQIGLENCQIFLNTDKLCIEQFN